MGKDPFTNAAWTGSHSWALAATYASKGNLTFISPGPFIPNTGTRNSNVLQMSMEQYG
jgi:hypothetical protein